MNPQFYPAVAVRASTNIIISKVANGWVLELPHTYEPAENEMGNAVQEGMMQALPFVRQIMKEMDKDPLLSKLQGEEDEPAKPIQKVPPEKIGTQQNIHVFPTMEELLFFLSQEFPD